MDPSVTTVSSTAVTALRSACDAILGALFDTAQALRRRDPSAGVRFVACRRRAQRCRQSDERVLYPLLEADGADTGRLRRDYAALDQTLEQARIDLERGAVDDFCDRVQDLMLAYCAQRIRTERLVRAHAAALDAADGDGDGARALLAQFLDE